MRTTLTLEPDVERCIARLRKQKGIGLKDLINQALRLGLERLEQPTAASPSLPTRSMNLGACKLQRLDDIAEALAVAENDSFR